MVFIKFCLSNIVQNCLIFWRPELQEAILGFIFLNQQSGIHFLKAYANISTRLFTKLKFTGSCWVHQVVTQRFGNPKLEYFSQYLTLWSLNASKVWTSKYLDKSELPFQIRSSFVYDNKIKRKVNTNILKTFQDHLRCFSVGLFNKRL